MRPLRLCLCVLAAAALALPQGARLAEASVGGGQKQAVSAAEAAAALRAWGQLRPELQRELAHGDTAGSAGARAAAAESDGVASRIQQTDISVTAENSFTAVSAALDELQRRARPGGGPKPAISGSSFVIDGGLDTTAVEDFLHKRRESLADTERTALEKVVAMLAKRAERRGNNTTSTAAPRA